MVLKRHVMLFCLVFLFGITVAPVIAHANEAMNKGELAFKIGYKIELPSGAIVGPDVGPEIGWERYVVKEPRLTIEAVSVGFSHHDFFEELHRVLDMLLTLKAKPSVAVEPVQSTTSAGVDIEYKLIQGADATNAWITANTGESDVLITIVGEADVDKEVIMDIIMSLQPIDEG